MKKIYYYSSITEISGEKYLLIFLVCDDFPPKEILKEIKQLAQSLSINPESNVIFDYFYRNGHCNYIFNRFFLVNTFYQAKELNKFTDIMSVDEMFEIGYKCNSWWLDNFDLLNYFDQSERKYDRLKNCKFNLTWIK